MLSHTLYRDCIRIPFTAFDQNKLSQRHTFRIHNMILTLQANEIFKIYSLFQHGTKVAIRFDDGRLVKQTS